MLNMYQIVDIGNGQINQDYNTAKNKDQMSNLYGMYWGFFFLHPNVFKRITERVIFPNLKVKLNRFDKEKKPKVFNQLHAFSVCLLSMREIGTKISLYHDLHKSLDSVLSDIFQ